MGSSEPGLLLHQPEVIQRYKGRVLCVQGRGWGEAFVRLFYTLQGGRGLEEGDAGEPLSIWGGAESGAEALESF